MLRVDYIYVYDILQMPWFWTTYRIVFINNCVDAVRMLIRSLTESLFASSSFPGRGTSYVWRQLVTLSSDSIGSSCHHSAARTEKNQRDRVMIKPAKPYAGLVLGVSDNLLESDGFMKDHVVISQHIRLYTHLDVCEDIHLTCHSSLRQLSHSAVHFIASRTNST